jgi:dodecin
MTPSIWRLPAPRRRLRELRWFEVVETRGHIDNGKVEHFQVTLKVGFTLEGS